MNNPHLPGKRPLISRWVVGCAAVGWMTAAACGIWSEVAERQRGRMASALADRALAAQGASLRAVVSELERLGLPSVEPLAELATCQRPDVAAAAQQALGRMLTTWEVTATEQGDAKMFAVQAATLAAALDAHGDRFGAEGQRWANQLAQRLVTHSEQFPVAESWDVLASCDSLLSRPVLPLPKQPVSASTTPASAAQPAPPTILPTVPPPAPQPAPTAPMATNARPLAKLTVVPPQPTLSAAGPSSNSSGNGLRPPLSPPEEVAPTAASVPPIGRVVDVPSPQEVRLQARAMRELSNRTLVARAAEGAATAAPAAKKALRDRGFSDGMLELTRQLEALPPPERRAALQRASELPPSDARKVLRWFVTDADADVRLQALTMLATTGDPQLGELARERAVEDADPRVAAFASELMRTR